MDNDDLILAQCLDEIDAGQRTLAECIALYPNLTAELTELHETVAILQQVPVAGRQLAAPSSTFQAGAATRLFAKIEQAAAPASTPSPRQRIKTQTQSRPSFAERLRAIFAAPPRAAWAFAMAAILFVGGFATYNSAINATYGSSLHNLKTSVANRQIASETDEIARLNLVIEQLEARIAEMEALSDAEQIAYIDQAGDDFLALGTQAITLLDSVAQTENGDAIVTTTHRKLREFSTRTRALKGRKAVDADAPLAPIDQFDDLVTVIVIRETLGIEAGHGKFIRNIIDENPQFSEIKTLFQWQEDDSDKDIWDQLGRGDNAAGYTLFLPDNVAMKASADALAPYSSNKEQVREILLYHRLIDIFSLERLAQSGNAMPTQGCQPLRFTMDGDTLVINDDVRVISEAIPVRNGRIYLIDNVLVPDAFWSIPDSGCS